MAKAKKISGKQKAYDLGIADEWIDKPARSANEFSSYSFFSRYWRGRENARASKGQIKTGAALKENVKAALAERGLGHG